MYTYIIIVKVVKCSEEQCWNQVKGIDLDDLLTHWHKLNDLDYVFLAIWN